MFRRKRQLKKEKLKNRALVLLFSLIGFLILILFAEYLYLHFSFEKTYFISPIAKTQYSKTIALENLLKIEDVSFSSVYSSQDTSFIVNLKNGGRVILSSKKDIKKQISSLQLILSRLTIEGKKLKVLDFRFDNPVVTF